MFLQIYITVNIKTVIL